MSSSHPRATRCCAPTAVPSPPLTSRKPKPGLESPVARRALRQMRSNDHVRLEPLLAQKCGGEDRKQRFDSKRGKLDFSVSVSGFQHFLSSRGEIRWTKRKSGRISGRDFRRQNGVLAQLVERLNGIEEVRGSIPLGSTAFVFILQQVQSVRVQ